jgi:hypothetical protein
MPANATLNDKSLFDGQTEEEGAWLNRDKVTIQRDNRILLYGLAGTIFSDGHFTG